MQPEAPAAVNHDVPQRLRALVLDESASLQAFRRLAREMTDPTAGVALGLLARDTEQDRTLLQRIVAGALDALNWTCSSAGESQWRGVARERAIAEIEVLSQTAFSRAQAFRDLACTERDLDHAPMAMLLNAMANDSDKHARLLAELGRHLEGVARETPRFSSPTGHGPNG